MQHRNDSSNNFQALFRHLQPHIECGDHLFANILARLLRDIVVRPHNNAFFFVSPLDFFGLCPIHTRSISAMFTRGAQWLALRRRHPFALGDRGQTRGNWLGARSNAIYDAVGACSRRDSCRRLKRLWDLCRIDFRSHGCNILSSIVAR